MSLLEQIDNRLDYMEFAVSNIAESKRFYGEVFGWTFTDYGPDYCEFCDGRMKGGFHTQEPVSTGGALIVLYHSDLESVQEKVLRAGGIITKEVFEFPGGKRFQFKDLDGHELGVWHTT
jgi:predicted enzyme related to lactoylglutathione lyase